MPITSQGYAYIRIKGHPLAQPASGGVVTIHRLVWFDANGPIPEGHVIHHLNGDKSDNRIQNLECVSRSTHSRIHNPHGRLMELQCVVCNQMFQRKEWKQASNLKFTGRNLRPVCSKRCWARLMNSIKWKQKRELQEQSNG